MLLTLSFAAFANDELTAEQDLSAADDAAARLWGASEVNVYVAHTCNATDTAEDCAVPSANMQDPAVYVRFWSPLAQDYNFYVIIADAAGAVDFLGILGPISASSGQKALKISSSGIANLPEGYYFLTVAVVGQTDGKRGISHQYYFHTTGT